MHVTPTVTPLPVQLCRCVCTGTRTPVSFMFFSSCDSRRLHVMHITSPRARTCLQVSSIHERGMSTDHAAHGMYGKGLYFTDSSCKANYYGGGHQTRTGIGGACILICRVVLGNIRMLDTLCSKRKGPPPPAVQNIYETCPLPCGTRGLPAPSRHVVTDGLWSQLSVWQ